MAQSRQDGRHRWAPHEETLRAHHPPPPPPPRHHPHHCGDLVAARSGVHRALSTYLRPCLVRHHCVLKKNGGVLLAPFGGRTLRRLRRARVRPQTHLHPRLRRGSNVAEMGAAVSPRLMPKFLGPGGRGASPLLPRSAGTRRHRPHPRPPHLPHQNDPYSRHRVFYPPSTQTGTLVRHCRRPRPRPPLRRPLSQRLGRRGLRETRVQHRWCHWRWLHSRQPNETRSMETSRSLRRICRCERWQRKAQPPRVHPLRRRRAALRSLQSWRKSSSHRNRWRPSQTQECRGNGAGHCGRRSF